jgi:hypothetical protein
MLSTLVAMKLQVLFPQGYNFVLVCHLVSTTKGRVQAEVLEHMALRGIFGQKEGEMAGSWRKIHNEELHNRY